MKSRWGFYGNGIMQSFSIKELREQGYKLVNIYSLTFQEELIASLELDNNSKGVRMRYDLVMVSDRRIFK